MDQVTYEMFSLFCISSCTNAAYFIPRRIILYLKMSGVGRTCYTQKRSHEQTVNIPDERL